MVFAKRVSEHSRPLGGKAQLWVGKLEDLEANGTCKMNEIDLADSSSDSFASPYADKARQGATVVPRVLYFVDVQESATALVKGIKKVSPQRSSQEKEPWKSLHPPELIDAPIEEEHIWDIHLGETVAPYVLLDARKAVLPVRKENSEEAARQINLARESKASAEADRDNSPAGKAIGKLDISDAADAICRLDPKSMDTRMRDRWKVINELWDTNKIPNNKLDLVSRLNYQRGLTAQLEDYAPIRLLYATSGRPTASVLLSPTSLADTKLYWVKCETLEEAHYLAAIINSDTLEEAVQKFMPKGQFGARDLHKHLWRLPIPTYDPADHHHATLAKLGSQLATEASTHLAAIHTTRATENKPTTITVARRELRLWLSTHPPAQQVENLVAKLLE